ncbi:hypothetical protein DL93DRAFT_2062600 [Clavulina sp. PMI_390]|nr:hypothetical protein DL93DRAFT_2062600 [Clavulina sp. PMI_390]
MVKRSTLIKKIRSVVAEGLSCCPSSLHLIHDGYRARDEDPISTLEEDGEVEIYLYQEQVGGKPVIYLFPPVGRALHASVSLSLVPEWSFSAVYPIAPVKPIGNHQGERITWNVEVKPGGDMIDKSSQLEVSYLFWEAHTNVGKPLSPPASRPASPVDAAAAANGLEDFTPLTASLLPSNSVLITFDEVTTYIDRSLKMLDLHVEARTSFITYWLPALSAHKFIALRFVSQASYERAAQLDVTPKPDVVERIFMLFQGLTREAASAPEWLTATERAEEDVRLWRDIVGLQGEPGTLMKDESLFRVLEWGGMEVR